MTLHQDSRKAAKAANIATYRPDGYLAALAVLAALAAFGSFVRRDTSGCFCTTISFMRSGQGIKSG